MYVTEAAKMHKLWREACAKAKGTKTKVGSVKNYTFAGLMIAYTMDDKEGAEQKKAIENLMLREMGDANGQLDMAKAAQLDKIVGQAGVKQGATVAYVNLRLHDGYEAIAGQIHNVFMRIGKQQFDPPPPTPVARVLRKHMLEVKGRQK